MNKSINKFPAVLVLADGTVFKGTSIGKIGTTTGEICFNTGMTGYQEVFTDPSYYGQILLQTNVHIGNYGIHAEEVESDDIMFLKNIKGISISSIYSLENGMYDFIDFVENSIIPVKIEKCDKVESSGSLLSGVSVCFTGVRDKDMEEKIQNNGGKILSGVSKNTTHLILDDINSTSSKASKARELGIILLTIEKAKELWEF